MIHMKYQALFGYMTKQNLKACQMQILGGPLMATPYKNSDHFYGIGK